MGDRERLNEIRNNAEATRREIREWLFFHIDTLQRHKALLYNALQDFSRKGWLSPEAMVTSIHVLAEIDAEDKEEA